MVLWKCKSPRFSISYFPNITKIIGFFDLSYHGNFFFFPSFVSNSQSKQKLRSPVDNYLFSSYIVDAIQLIFNFIENT